MVAGRDAEEQFMLPNADARQQVRTALPFADELVTMKARRGGGAGRGEDAWKGRGEEARWWSLVLALLWGLGGALAFWGLVDIVRRSSAAAVMQPFWWSRGWRPDGLDWISPHPHECFCGETWQEALEMGCRFDELASIWLRPQCIDEELSREFSRSGPGPNGSWPYYYNHNETGPEHVVSAAELSMRDDLFAVTYTVFEWHIQHCTFYWRKLFRQPMTGVVMEPHFDIEHHVVHCGMGFLKRNNLSSITAGVAHVRPRGMIDVQNWQISDTDHVKYEKIPLTWRDGT
ncbi:hypothetical protein AC578_9939 [Pseudocercospora eumusae]|uniref:Uncharacterized protein n=1 Tax=Pseudocercospora eumusae TaxID=321146 RepID=A0A139HB24_9PEZI|nr:hypothetical protein AC578_9939 [Pseudocercospora eumusae]